MRFVIHDTGTGRILRHGHCPDEDLPHQPVPAGHALLSLPDDHPPIDDRIHQVEAGAIADRPPTAPDPAALLAALRRSRNARLAACDWTQLADVPMTADRRAAWARYRQALRDLPATTDLSNPVWPQPPAQ